MPLPTDAKLMHRARERLVRLAQARGVTLRQSYVRVGNIALIRHQRYAHAKQFKRATRALRSIRTMLGRVIRDITHKIVGRPELADVFALPLSRARRVKDQRQRQRGHPRRRAVARTSHGRARGRGRRRCVRASAPARERDTAGAILPRLHVRARARVQRDRGIDELSSSRHSSPTSTPRSPAQWEANPFRDDVTMSEDQEWSRRMLLAGHTIVYEPSAAVRHSHTYSLRGAFKRFYDSGASADRSYVAGDESRAAIRRALKRYATGELRWLWTTGQRRWIP